MTARSSQFLPFVFLYIATRGPGRLALDKE